MTKLILLTCLLCSGMAFGQQEYPKQEWLGSGEFVITGQVFDKPEKMESWRLAVTDYLDNIGYDVPLDAEGRFEMTIPVRDVQDIYLYLGNVITIFTFPGDTIRLSFNGNNPDETISLSGTTEQRTKELELCMEIYRQYRQAFLDVHRLAYDKGKSSQEKLDAMDEYYKGQIALIDTFDAEHGPLPFLRKFQDETYYHIARIAVRENGLLPQVKCDYARVSNTTTYVNNDKRDTLVTGVLPYQVLDYTAFRTIPLYRDFLSISISYHESGFPWSVGYPEVDSKEQDQRLSLPARYELAKKWFGRIPPIQDWYLALQLKDALTYEPLTDVDSLYHDFVGICRDEVYLAELGRKYQQALRLEPGQQAPDFELADLDGNLIRLSDFRGKIIYMDFWGNGCGPCIYEFQHSKEKFMEKYGSEEIVFVYVCVDSDDEGWRKGVEKYKLEGVNLHAKGWASNPACQAYNVEGIPHYVLIDKEGNIVKSDCDRPSVLLQMGADSELEQLLQRYK